MCMFWALDAIQSGRVKQGKPFLRHPPEAATAEPFTRYTVQRWDTETLIQQALITPKNDWSMSSRPSLDTKDFNSVVELVNTLRDVEEDENKVRIDATNILIEMHRISHRQFAWQNGWVNRADIYRYLYVYGQGDSAAYFERTYGISVPQFFGACFAIYMSLLEGPWSPRIENVDQLGISAAAVKQTYSMISDEIWAVRRGAQKLLRQFEERMKVALPVIYQPSYIRVKPVFRSAAMNDFVIAPLPSLIMLRATLGLYYDLSPGGTAIMNDATNRFEDYSRKVIKEYCPDFEVLPAETYKHAGNNVDTPDVLIKQADQVVMVCECKATKLTFEAQYSDDPIEDAKTGYSQIAKAVYQLWKFFSHVRRGILKMDVAATAPAVVLTLDSWGQMAGSLRQQLISEAEAMAAAKDPEITAEDRRRPIFTPIQDLEHVLSTSSEQEVLETFYAAIEDKFLGWGLLQIRRQIQPERLSIKSTTFSLGDLLPWWKDVPDTAKEKAREAAKA